MIDKLTPEQFAELRLVEHADTALPRAVTLSGSVGDLVTVAANALPILDSSLTLEGQQTCMEKLRADGRVTTAFGQFGLSLLQHDSDTGGAPNAELNIRINTGPSGLMVLIRAALENSVEPTG